MPDKRLDCVCDGCGRRAKCAPSAKGPRGWFYVEIFEDSNGLPTTALACSKPCQQLPWKPVSKERGT